MDANSSAKRAGPLSEFTVLELTVARAGPTAARQLADWGANVIKIETPERMEAPNGLSVGAMRDGSDFQNLNRNRRGLSLNLKSPEGIATLMRLIDKADVLIENYRPDVKRRLGFDFEAVQKRNPRLVYASISGFGQSGPYVSRPGVDQIVQGMSGLMSITGEAGGTPLRTGIAIGDTVTGLLCAYGVLAALHERNTSGKGQWVQNSLLHSLIFIEDFQAARWVQDGVIPRAAGNNHPTIRPTGLFKARDGYINIAATPEMWPKICRVLGITELENDERFATPPARIENTDALNALMEERTIAEPAAKWIDDFNSVGVPCGPVYTMDQVFEDPQVKSLELPVKVASAKLGELRQVRQPIEMSRTPSKVWGAAPERGEDNGTILREFGFTDAEVAALEENGAL